MPLNLSGEVEKEMEKIKILKDNQGNLQGINPRRIFYI